MSTLELVLADLDAECTWLDGLVAGLADDETGWRRPTPAVGWDVAHQVAHLAWTDEVAVLAATDRAAWDAVVLTALGDADHHVDAAAAAGAQADAPELLGRWRRSRASLARALRGVPQDERMPWFGPPMSPASMATARFMETWAHGRDVADALGVPAPRDDRVRHVVHLGIRTRGFAFAGAGHDVPAAPIHVSLALPGGGHHEDGPADADQSVRGSAYDFALLVTQRVHRADTDLVAVGPDADHWLDLAQAFAGPAGGGRAPAGAPR